MPGDGPGRADGEWIYPLRSGGTRNICRTSALLEPAVQGQGEVLASLTRVPSRRRATGKLHHSRGQKEPNGGSAPAPAPHCPRAPALPPPSTSSTSAASPFPTGVPSATLHPKCSPLRTHVLGDKGCFQYSGFAQGVAEPQSGCPDLMVTKITMTAATDFSKDTPPVRKRRSRLDLSKTRLTFCKRWKLRNFLPRKGGATWN